MSKIKVFTLLGSFCIAFIKSLIIPPTFADVAVIAVIGAMFAYLEYKTKDKELEKLVIAVKKQEDDIEELKNKMSSIKFVQQVKPNSLSFK